MNTSTSFGEIGNLTLTEIVELHEDINYFNELKNKKMNNEK
jgi:hypothetical protein